ncbi:chalcone isomerase family protein [Pseudoalteromonas aliena]|uniref:chalcone isomerase family protein n=1 Tax=Pseudoalteromonas aliena TaxID=247523 RepID=UPI00311DB062
MKLLLKAITFYLLTTSIVLANTQFNKVGEARMEYLFWDVYDAVLFTRSGNYSAGTHPIKFKLTYLRDFKAKEIVKATNEQWKHIGKKQLADKYDSKLLSIWPDIRQGDSLTLVTNEQGMSTFYHNDEKIGEISESQFSSDFLAIWLDEKTSEPKLRKQLLGN